MEVGRQDSDIEIRKNLVLAKSNISKDKSKSKSLNRYAILDSVVKEIDSILSD